MAAYYLEEMIMWRSVFLAAGIVLCVLGGECLIVEKVVLAKKTEEKPAASTFFVPMNQPATDEIKPPEWAPWSLLSAGTVIMLYSYTIPRRHAA